MSKLIIAEKPSLARGVVEALGSIEHFQRKNGYYEGTEYMVSYAYGHLFGLINLEEYMGKDAPPRWTLDILPFFPGEGRPEDYRFALLKKKPKNKKKGKEKIDDGVKKQFDILKNLMNRSDVEEIIHCGDADREGEVIIRLIIEKGLKKKKRVSRLWLPDQTSETILEQIRERKEDSEYDALYEEGLCRTLMDWMCGINLTRYVTLNMPGKEVYSVGRVLSPIVKCIYDREMEIRNFRPETYLVLESNQEFQNVPIKLTRERSFWPKNTAELGQLGIRLNSAEARVIAVRKKQRIRTRPKLFSLSKLQGVLGKKYQMDMETSLHLVQELYELGCITYPRTNTEYLAEREKEKVKKLLELFRKEDMELPVLFRDGKRIFDDKKVESHSALIPTGKSCADLSEEQKKVYHTIRSRFFAAFCEGECLVEDTVVSILCADMEFRVKGSVIVSPGWMQFELPEREEKETLIPNMKEGDLIPHFFELKEKVTKAPGRYTPESLSNHLKNPFSRAEDENDDEEYRELMKGIEIGTEATRTPIITKAIQTGYISYRQGKYFLEPKGELLITSMARLGVDISEQTTVEMQMLLKDVYHGNIQTDEALKRMEDYVRNCFGKG